MSDLINPNWPDGLDRGEIQDRRNVIDTYKYWDTEAIKAHLDENRTPLALLLENYANDFNIGTTIRSANAFGVGSICITGRRRYDTRGTVGTNHYENIDFSATSAPVIEEYKAKGYKIVAVDNIEGASPIDTYKWDEKTLMIFGQEAIGVSPTALEAADDVVYIPQRGSVRSLNVGAASAIFINHYTTQVSPIV